jgi:universal stress protein E
MQPIRRILVAVKNPQGKASPAVIKAAQLAQALGASLELFHAIVTPLYVDSYSLPNGSLADTERDIQQRCLVQLRATAKRLKRQAIEVSVAAEWDFPGYEAVIRRANRIKADLIVADLHAGSHVVAGILHLTDWELLRLSATPVLLVKTKARYRQPVILAAVDPTHTRAKPAALDSEILSVASSITDSLHGTLHAVHAYISAPPSVWPSNTAGALSLPRLMAQTARKARQVLDRALEATEIPRSRRHLIDRHPINAIEETSRRIRSSIVVMGAVSRSGLKGLFIGNTAERVLDSLACDVLVVKPASFKQRVARSLRGVKLLSAAPMAFPI